MANNADNPQKQSGGFINLLVDYGPILIFFLVYRHYSPSTKGDEMGEVFAVARGTGAFIVAALIALGVSKWRLGRISPMLWLSTALIVGFGLLTIYLNDPFYVQIKPTVIYLMFSAALLVGVWRDKALLKTLLGAAFEGLDDAGWMKLSRNWGWFFLALALLNEGLRYYLTFGQWLGAKLWVFIPLSFLFTFSQIPMLMKHGLGEDGKKEAETSPPQG